MAIKHVVTFGFGFADDTKFIPPMGFLPDAVSLTSTGTIKSPSATGTLYSPNATGTMYSPNSTGTLTTDTTG